MRFIHIFSTGGIDWHDTMEKYDTISFDGKYEIPKEKTTDAIVEDIWKRFENVLTITKQELFEKVAEVIQSNVVITLPLYTITTTSNGNETKEVVSETREGRVEYENELTLSVENGMILSVTHQALYGEILYEYDYQDWEIPDEDLRYEVIEHFECPMKGIPFIDRMYSDVFKTREEAEEYAKTLKTHDNPSGLGTEIYVYPVRWGDTQDNDWYLKEMEIINLMAEKNVDAYDSSFDLMPVQHYSNLKKIA